MNRKNLIAIIFILGIAPLSMITWALSFEKAAPAEEILVRSEVPTLDYNAFIRMGPDEMEETKGKVGPVIVGAASGIVTGVIGAYATAPNNSPSNLNIIAGGAGGAVGGALYPIIGPTGSALIGISVAAGINDVFGASSGGCYSNGCHGVKK